MTPMPLLLVTSTGRASRQLIVTLLSLPECPAIRVIARSNANIQENFPPQLRSAPHSLVVADHFQGKEFESAFKGVSIVFHNGPAVHAQEEAMSIAVIDAAKEAGVKHLVFCSVFQPMRTKLHTHKVKLCIEEYLVESRLNYTILQPAHYMQNVSFDNIIKSGKITIAYSSSVVHGFIDLSDLVIIARNIILSPAQHNFAQYPLVAQNVSYHEIASIISTICRKDIRCDVVPAKEFVARMKASGEVKGEYAEDAIERLMLYYNRWGLIGNSNVMRWLLGREPTTWEDYTRRELQQQR